MTRFFFERSERFDDFSPNATLSYQVTPKILTYASYATGFRSGGFNGRATSINMDTGTIDPEDLTTYEVGAKTTFFEDRLLLNVAQFYSVYSDIQRPILQKATPIPIPTVVFRNAAEARLHGTELELIALPFAGLRLESALSAFRGRYTDFDSPNQPNIDDARLPGQPNYLASFAVGYQREIGIGLWSTRLQWTYRGTQGNDTVDSDSVRSNKYGLLDGRIGLELMDGKTEIALFGSNLLDRVYFTNGFDASSSVGVGVRFLGPPRRYGLEVRRAF
jgi:iron complex outermembrane receptor protein